MSRIRLLILIGLWQVLIGCYAKTPSNPTAIFDPAFRTLQVRVNDRLMADDVIRLGGTDKIVFSFDEIGDDRSYLRCRLLHCNVDWEPSMLVESEYVDGFNEAAIEDFGYSRNTYIHYVNYRFSLGEEGLRPLVAGNYVWQVYDEENPDDILLQARFRVSDDRLAVTGWANGRTDTGFNTEFQQLSLTLSPTDRPDYNAYTDLLVEVTRNGRPDTSRLILHPQRVEGDKIIYEHIPAMIFPAGNEYRRFETVRADYPGMRVDSVRYIAPVYQAYVTPDRSREGKDYLYDSTQRGRYQIDEYNSTDPDLGADYVTTHFTLDFPRVMDGEIYIEGDLALRGYTEFNKMKYSESDGMYHLDMPLKQGSYNYQYVIIPGRLREDSAESLALIGGGQPMDSSGRPIVATEALTEGNKYETINEYNVYVYLRRPGQRYEPLLGTATIVATP